MTLVWVEGISGRRVSVALGRLDGLKLHCLPFRLATYVGISVCRNFFLLPVSVASPLNDITLVRNRHSPWNKRSPWNIWQKQLTVSP